jgi:LacI family transcriptional regulator
MDDPVVARALHLIRQSACSGINVEELLGHLPVSRATLERRFAKLLQRTPKDEILRLRIDRARQLLRETNHNLATIAKSCGFKTAAHLSVTFKAHTHQSPGQYRTASSGTARQGE